MADGAPNAPSLFRDGVNCWRTARAERVALLVDGDEYFRAFRAAAEKARRSILLLAWDFNSRTQLHCGEDDGVPQVLGDFLNFLVRRRRALEVRVLIWDYPMIFGTDREFPSVYGLGWKPHRRVRVRYDNTHPVTGSHHQKVMVVDDNVAFCGGLDLTCRRWDTHEHRPDDERRCEEGSAYPPFHDAMMMVDGAAARSLGDLARDRWLLATGRRLNAVGRAADAWPGEIEPAIRRVDVAIARTVPPSDGVEPVREVEALYFDMIAAARRTIYIENQYFTAHKLGEALAARLAEADGPEIVLVLRLLSHGWLEELTMENLRKAMIARLRAADRHGRFHVFYPHIDGLADGKCIDIHSKVIVVDDQWLRVGSANISNRSMGFDTECDLAVEAGDRKDVSRAIGQFRNRLLAEHLGTEPALVERELGAHGSIGATVKSLGTAERSLKRLDHEPEASNAVMTLASLADPEQPVTLENLIAQFAPRGELRRAGKVWLKAGGLMVLVAALAAAWRFTALADWITAERITAWARAFADAPWAPFAVMTAFIPAAVVMFPRPLITLFAVVAFGPWLGFTYSMTGILVSALLTYVAGMRFDRSTVRRLSGPKLDRIIRVLRERGLVAMTALRLVPLAPFAVEGVIAGAIRIKLVDFMLGTAFGMLPGVLAATVFGDQLEAALRDPGEVNFWLIAGVVVALVVASLAVRRWLLTTELRAEGHRPQRR